MRQDALKSIIIKAVKELILGLYILKTYIEYLIRFLYPLLMNNAY